MTWRNISTGREPDVLSAQERNKEMDNERVLLIFRTVKPGTEMLSMAVNIVKNSV